MLIYDLEQNRYMVRSLEAKTLEIDKLNRKIDGLHGIIDGQRVIIRKLEIEIERMKNAKH